MSSGRRLAQNTLYLTMASVGQKAVAFLYFTAIARYIGVEDTGSYFLALAIVMIILVLDDLGVTSVLIREVARQSNDAQLWTRTILGIKVFTIPMTLAIAFFLPSLLHYSDTVVTLVRVATLILVADTLSLSFYGILRGLQTLKHESIGLFIGQTITAIVGVSLLISGEATLPLLVLALATGSIWNMVFSASRVAKYAGWKSFIPSWSLGWKPLKMAFAFFMAAVFVKIYSYADSIMLGHFLGESAVGIYAVAYKFTYAFQFIPLTFVAALYPTMSSHAADPVRLKQIFLDSLWYVCLIGAPIVLGIWSLAPEIMTFFYGSDFAASIVPLEVLIFVLVFIFLDFPVGSLLNATDRQQVKTTIMGCTMVLNVCVNMLLIPWMGVLGACIAALVSFVFMFLAGWMQAMPIVHATWADLWKRTYRIFLAALVMAGAVYVAKPFLSFFPAMILGAIVYGGLILGLRVVTKSQMKDAIGLLRKES